MNKPAYSAEFTVFYWKTFLILYLNNFYPAPYKAAIQDLSVWISEFYHCLSSEIHSQRKYISVSYNGKSYFTEVTNVRFMHFNPFRKMIKFNQPFHHIFRRNTCYLNILYSIKFIKEFFDFTWIDIFATTNNHILDTSCDPVISVLIFNAQSRPNAGSYFINHFSRSFRFL